VLAALCNSSVSARLAKRASCFNRRSPSSAHSLTTFVLPMFALSTSPPYRRVAVETSASVLQLRLMDGSMSPLNCLLATISLIAPTCRGEMGVLRRPSIMVLVIFLSAGDKLGAFLCRTLGKHSTLKTPESGRSGQESPIMQSH